MSMKRLIRVIDSHTGGEPTRVVIAGGPDLGGGSMAERREVFRREHDAFRSAVVNEPRGSDVVVGALLCEPVDPRCAAGVVFFNNVGYLGMCGHGTIGLAVTLAHLGRIGVGEHRVETPVGVVTVTLHDPNTATIENVPSYRAREGVRFPKVGPLGSIVGDVAWGGNWFFLVHEHPMLELTHDNVGFLTDVARNIKHALSSNGIRGDDGAEIDHVELFGPPVVAGADGRNFVLCPGDAYDRSPCGTGTSAKVACLISDGTLREGEVWLQEGILGTVFEASGRVVEGKVVPRIKGTAFVNAEATLIVDPADPFAWGIRR